MYNVPTIVLIGLVLLATLIVVETGIRVGQRFGRTTWSNAHDVHTALSGAALALMGLMLAFTFNMSATRYDVRRTMIVTEATAIQSVRSDLDFLAPGPKARAVALIQQYLERRIEFLEVGHNRLAEATAVRKSRALHAAMWQIATSPASYAATEPQLRAVQYVQLTQALQDLNTVGRQREAARSRRVPEAVLILLFALAIGSGGLLAYMSGASGHPDRLPTYMVLVMVCLVIYVIIDFDRPRRGLMPLDSGVLRSLLQVTN